MCTFSDGVSSEENDAQMSLSAAHPTATATATATAAPSAAPPLPAPSPAVGALVSRFTAPTGSHPPVEPSVVHAMLNCKVAIGNYLANLAAVAIAIPETAGGSLIASGKVLLAAAGAQSCISQNETQQVTEGNLANLAADCHDAGAIALTTTDGNVVCAK